MAADTMKRLLPVFMLAWLSVLLAQQTVVQPLFSGATKATTTSGTLIKNVGQTGHQVYLQFASAPGKTCSLPAAVAEIQSSFDGSNWNTLGYPQILSGSYSGSLSRIYSGTGLFNYVRFVLQSFDTSNCTASAWYTGAPGAGLYGNSQGVAPPGSQVDSGLTPGLAYHSWTQNPVFIGGYGWSGGLTPLIICDASVQATVTAGSTTKLITADGQRIQVCSVVVSMAATGLVQFSSGTGASCSSGNTAVTPAFNLNAGVPLSMGGGIAPLFPMPGTRNDLCASATTGDAKVFLTYTVINY